ncbi:unnamed protein product [Cunninghamella blakesleeana]
MAQLDNIRIRQKLLDHSSKVRMPYLCALNKSLGWPILSEGQKGKKKGLQTHYFQINEKEKYITSMACQDNMIVMGSGNPEGHLYFIEDQKDERNINNNHDHGFKLSYQTQLDIPIYSLDWTQQHLLIGSKHGIIQLYKTEHFEEEKDPTLSKMSEYHFNMLPETYVSPPSSTALNSKVKKLKFHPTMNQFLACVGDRIELWDIHSLNLPSSSYQPDGQIPLQTCQWSLLSPDLFVTAGDAGHLHIIDIRMKEKEAIVWQTYHAHKRSIHDATFNPFIPYWLASAGHDHLVHIWDLRSISHQPVGKIDGHQGPITSVTWGNMRSEQLSTTSMDGTFRMWSLSKNQIPLWDTPDSDDDHLNYNNKNKNKNSNQGRKKKLSYDLNQEENWWSNIIEPEYRLNDDQFIWDFFDDDDKKSFHSHNDNQILPVGALGIGEWGKMNIGQIYDPSLYQKSKGSIIQGLASKTKPGVFYCVTDYGQLCSHTFIHSNDSPLDMLQRYDYQDEPLYYNIDFAIYNRQIDLANNLINELKEMPVLDDTQKKFRDEQIEKFNDDLKIAPPIQPEDWRFNSIPDPNDKLVSKRLWTDVDKWEYAIEAFKKDLTYWQYKLPPGCDHIYNIPLDTENQLLPRDSISVDSNEYFEPFTPIDETSGIDHDKRLSSGYIPYFDQHIKKEELDINSRGSLSTPISPISPTMMENKYNHYGDDSNSDLNSIDNNNNNNDSIPLFTRKRSNTLGSFKQKLSLSRSGSLRSLSKRINHNSGTESPISISSFDLHQHPSSPSPSSPLKKKPSLLLLSNSMKKSVSSPNIDSQYNSDYDNYHQHHHNSVDRFITKSPKSLLTPSGSIRRLKKKMTSSASSPTGMVISSPVLVDDSSAFPGIQLIDHKIVKNQNNEDEDEDEEYVEEEEEEDIYVNDSSSPSSAPLMINSRKSIISVLPTTPEAIDISLLESSALPPPPPPPKTRYPLLESTSTPDILNENSNHHQQHHRHYIGIGSSDYVSKSLPNTPTKDSLRPKSTTILETVNENNNYNNYNNDYNIKHQYHHHHRHGLSRTKSVLLAPAKSIKRAFSKRTKKNERNSIQSNLSKSTAGSSISSDHHRDDIKSENYLTPGLDRTPSKNTMNL